VTLDERVDRVRELGYTEREARFLAVAGLHSGYFLRRQFTQSTGAGSGKAAASFTAKLLRFDHATVVAVCHNAHLFHLHAKPVYERLGIAESRNRRPRAPFAVKAKLMGLDYVLAHQDCAFFATYYERVAFFTQVLGVDREVLPAKFYGQGLNRRPRYFVDGFPLGLTTSPDGRPLLAFCYVDDGGSSVSAFQTYLDQYRRLLRSLTAPAHVVFIGGCRRHFHAARVVFDHFLDEHAGESETGRHGLAARLLPYFRVRALYEARQFDQLTKEAMDLLRDGRDSFSGPRFDAWFEQWRVQGDRAMSTDVDASPHESALRHLVFATWCADQVYDLFGTVWAAS
jgi:hypothetical protein